MGKTPAKVERKVAKAAREFAHGELHSGSKKKGPLVKSKAQALAIGYSEGGERKKKK